MILAQSNLLNQFKELSSAFTTQGNGNFAYHVNDNPLIVDNNHSILAKKLNYDKRTLVHMKQIHSNIVHVVTDEDDFNNPPTCDALITNKLDTPLMVMVADCSPILFYEADKKVIAVAHAGRQGAFKNIVKNTINSFINNFSCNTKELYVEIGASIGKCCYEVGNEIYEEAKQLNLEYAIEQRDNSFYLDISKILYTQLLDNGIKKNNIYISDECTCCKNKKYYSYRANPKVGRFSGIIILKK